MEGDPEFCGDLDDCGQVTRWREWGDLFEKALKPARSDEDREVAQRGAYVAEGMDVIAWREEDLSDGGGQPLPFAKEFEVAVEYGKGLVFVGVQVGRRSPTRGCRGDDGRGAAARGGAVRDNPDLVAKGGEGPEIHGG